MPESFAPATFSPACFACLISSAAATVFPEFMQVPAMNTSGAEDDRDCAGRRALRRMFITALVSSQTAPKTPRPQSHLKMTNDGLYKCRSLRPCSECADRSPTERRIRDIPDKTLERTTLTKYTQNDIAFIDPCETPGRQLDIPIRKALERARTAANIPDLRP
jgi:hypothetical protein